MGDPSILDTDLSFTSDPRITTSIVYNTVHTIRNGERKEKSLGGEFCQPAFCFTDTYINIFRPSLQPRAWELCCHSQSQCCFLHHKKADYRVCSFWHGYHRKFIAALDLSPLPSLFCKRIQHRKEEHKNPRKRDAKQTSHGRQRQRLTQLHSAYPIRNPTHPAPQITPTVERR